MTEDGVMNSVGEIPRSWMSRFLREVRLPFQTYMRIAIVLERYS